MVFDEGGDVALRAPLVEDLSSRITAVRATAVVIMVRSCEVFVVCMVMFLGICIAGTVGCLCKQTHTMHVHRVSHPGCKSGRAHSARPLSCVTQLPRSRASACRGPSADRCP